MSKKMLFVLFSNTCLLQAADKERHTPVKSLAELREVIAEERQKTQIYKRNQNPHISTYRSGQKINGDPHQQKNTNEKK